MAATPAAVLKARYRYNGEPKKMKGAMSDPSGLPRSHERWARFRFSVIGPLLAAPPERGELQEQLKSLAAKRWHHPVTGQRVQFGLSTIERWFYRARNEKKDPVQALRRKIRSDQGGHPALSPKVRELLSAQYRSVATFRFWRKTPRFRDFAEKPVVDCEALRQGGFRAKSGFFGRIKSLQHFPFKCPGRSVSFVV